MSNVIRLQSQIDIAASVDRVWALTEDVESWPSITPTMTSVVRQDDGPLRVGSSARVVQPRQRPTMWTVTRLERPTTFEWRAKVLSITMTGSHQIEATSEGCRNNLSLELTGFGSALLARVAGNRLQEAIDTEDQGFKTRAELVERS